MKTPAFASLKHWNFLDGSHQRHNFEIRKNLATSLLNNWQQTTKKRNLKTKNVWIKRGKGSFVFSLLTSLVHCCVFGEIFLIRRYFNGNVIWIFWKNQGTYSQNCLSQIRTFFVTLGLNIMWFLRLKVFFKQISLGVDVTYNKNSVIPIFMCDGYSNQSLSYVNFTNLP